MIYLIRDPGAETYVNKGLLSILQLNFNQALLSDTFNIFLVMSGVSKNLFSAIIAAPIMIILIGIFSKEYINDISIVFAIGVTSVLSAVLMFSFAGYVAEQYWLMNLIYPLGRLESKKVAVMLAIMV